MEKATWIKELSNKITYLIGYPLMVDHIHHIHADGSGWFYYIENLAPRHPVLAMHYRGPLMLALPFEDYRRLESGEITVDAYVASSRWNYGYFWGGGGLISGAYWQPLEEGTGIHDTKRISRYLRILSCRTQLRSSGYGPTAERCAKCNLESKSCPFSTQNQTGSWENEVQEPDGRRAIFAAARQRVKAELGFDLYCVMSHRDDRDQMLLFPGYNSNTVQIYLQRDLLNELLYHPETQRNWKEIVSQLKIVLCIPWRPEESKVLPNDVDDKREFCLEFWGDRMSQEVINEELPEAGATPPTISANQVPRKPALFNFVRNFFVRR